MDTIANLLTSLRNAEMAGHSQVRVPSFATGRHILDILQKHGYVTEITPVEDAKFATLLVTFPEGKIRHSYKRMSKPGRRVYIEAANIPIVRRGTGIVILSTSKGVMAGKEAHKQGIGGELICEIF